VTRNARSHSQLYRKDGENEANCFVVCFSRCRKKGENGRALLPLKLRIKKINKSDYHQPLGALLGIAAEEPAIAAYQGPDLPHEMMLIAGCSDPQIHALLDALRNAGIPRIHHKAVLTENNQYWNALELYEELNQEYEYFRQQEGQ
jgi:hypothetical protein